MSNTQLYSHNANGIEYQDPASPGFKVRFKTSKTPKRLDNLRTNNVATEIIVNDVQTVSKDAATGDDPLSIRIRISGSELSHARLQEILAGLSKQLPIWSTENVILGFEPKTVPVKY